MITQLSRGGETKNNRTFHSRINEHKNHEKFGLLFFVHRPREFVPRPRNDCAKRELLTRAYYHRVQTVAPASHRHNISADNVGLPCAGLLFRAGDNYVRFDRLGNGRTTAQENAASLQNGTTRTNERPKNKPQHAIMIVCLRVLSRFKTLSSAVGCGFDVNPSPLSKFTPSVCGASSRSCVFGASQSRTHRNDGPRAR